MFKKYKSKSCISISVALSTGGCAHISFSPMTVGGSTFYTDDAVLQEGLEKHPKFGKLFELVEQDQSKRQAAKTYLQPQPKDDAGQDDISDAKAASVPEPGSIREITVQCNEDAKDYLAEKFGISRSKLRNRASIDEAGKANGVVFLWPDAKKSQGEDNGEPEEDGESDVNEVTTDDL